MADGQMTQSTYLEIDGLPARVGTLETIVGNIPITYQTIDNAASQDEVIADLIDHGAKNLVWLNRGTETINGVTLTVNDDLSVTLSGTSSGYFSFRIVGNQSSTAYQYAQPIEEGLYILTGLPASASATTFRYLLGITPSSSGTRTSESIYANKNFEITGDTTRFDLSIYVATGATFSTPVTVKPMICKQEYYTRTQKYVPGSPSNAELYKMILNAGGTRSLQTAAAPQTDPEQEER